MTLAFLLTAAGGLAFLLLSPFSRTPLWRATVTPLASIIGSGFLVSAPLLAREFGGFAAPAMALLIGVAALIGWTIRYNIRVVEPELARGHDRLLASFEELSHLALVFAYFISVAYYLSLLGHFLLEAAGVQNGALIPVRLRRLNLVTAFRVRCTSPGRCRWWGRPEAPAGRRPAAGSPQGYRWQWNPLERHG